MSRTLLASILVTAFFVFLGLALLGGMVWGNTLYSRSHPGEKDFFVPWLATRTFLDYGDSPYSNPVTQRAQVVYYGRLASDTEDPLILWFPFPGVLFYFPFALIPDYDLAHGLWMTLSEIALIASAFLFIQLTGWKLSRFFLPVVLLVPVLWSFGFINIIASNPLPFVLLASAGLLLCLRSGQDEITGALLVFPLLMAGIFGIFVFFFLWWTISHRRWRILAGLGMALVIILLLSFLLLPDWIMPFLRGLYWHVIHNPGVSTYRFLGSIWPVVGPRIGWVITAFIAILLIVEWRDSRKRDFRHLFWTACLTLAATPLLGFQIDIQFAGILSMPAFLFIAVLNERWTGKKLWRPGGIALILIWIGSWGLILWGKPSLFLIMPLLLLIGLYWMKWWVIRPPRTVSESMQ